MVHRLISICLLFFLCGASVTSQTSLLPLQVEVRGEGKTELVLIGCGGCDWRSWEPFMERNRKRYKMHAVTLPGRGGMPSLPVPKDATGTPLLDKYGALIASYIQDRRLKNVTIIGHSVGATVTLKTALNHPGIAEKIFLVDWGAIHPVVLGLSEKERLARAQQQRARVFAMTDQEFHARWPQMVSEEFSDPARAAVYLDMFRKMDRINSAQGSYEMNFHDLRDRLREITIPIGAVFGIPKGESEKKRRKEAGEVFRGANNLQLVFFEETRHWVMEDRPEEFDRLIADFITGRKLRGFTTIRKM